MPLSSPSTTIDKCLSFIDALSVKYVICFFHSCLSASLTPIYPQCSRFGRCWIFFICNISSPSYFFINVMLLHFFVSLIIIVLKTLLLLQLLYFDVATRSSFPCLFPGFLLFSPEGTFPRSNSFLWRFSYY